MSQLQEQIITTPSSISLTKDSAYNTNYDLKEGPVIDLRFGEISIQENSEGHRIMLKEKKSENTQICEKHHQQAQDRMQMNFPNLQEMLDFAIIKDNSTYKIRGYYELVEDDMEIELEYRKKNASYLSFHELRKLLIDILEAIFFQKSKKMVHGEIRPHYIFFNQDPLQFKLTDRLGDPSPPTHAQARNIRKKRPVYISPELYYNLVKQIKKTPGFQPITLSPYKSECFSQALVVLESGLLTNIQSIYDEDNCCV